MSLGKLPVLSWVSGSHGKRRLKSELTPDMISPPLGDFRHTMHVGRGGDVFGDTSFLSNHGGAEPAKANNFFARTLRHVRRTPQRRRGSGSQAGASPEPPAISPIIKNAVSLPQLNEAAYDGDGGLTSKFSFKSASNRLSKAHQTYGECSVGLVAGAQTPLCPAVAMPMPQHSHLHLRTEAPSSPQVSQSLHLHVSLKGFHPSLSCCSLIPPCWPAFRKAPFGRAVGWVDGTAGELFSGLTALGCDSAFLQGLGQKVSGGSGCLWQPRNMVGLRGKGKLRQCCHLLVPPTRFHSHWSYLPCLLPTRRPQLWALEISPVGCSSVMPPGPVTEVTWPVPPTSAGISIPCLMAT